MNILKLELHINTIAIFDRYKQQPNMNGNCSIFYTITVFENLIEYNFKLRWAFQKLDEDTVTVSHPINLTKLRHYEPFYISSDDIAPVDERFVGYGPTRMSQVKLVNIEQIRRIARRLTLFLLLNFISLKPQSLLGGIFM